MAKFYASHHSKLDLVVCKRCCSVFRRVEAERKTECPICHYDPDKEKRNADSLARVHGEWEDE